MTALDTNGDTDALQYTAADIEGRIQISAMWYDELDRLEDRVEFGTYGAANFDRDTLSAPARSDTALRTSYVYNTDGTLKETVDPKGLIARFEYDALGRRTKAIANYTDGTPGGGANDDQDQTVRYVYVDGLQTELIADLAGSSDDQTTIYDHGTTKGTSAGDSKIATGHLLERVTYPDSTGSGDDVIFAYNAQGQQIYKRDQAGNVLETEFDTAGRETHRRVSTLASGFDGAVRRISRTYNSRGQIELVTQYDNATVGAGAIVDEVKHTYEGWGLLSAFEQDRNSAVGAGGSVDDYEVSYTFSKATGGRNTVRQATMVLPSGATASYQYRSTIGLVDDDASRVTQIYLGAPAIVTYRYLGLDRVVGTAYDEPDVMSNLLGSSAGTYPGLDGFNRVVTSRWTKDLSTDVDFFNLALGYDRNSNITSADDSVHSGFDVLYTNDALNRLARAEEGTLSGGSISSRTRDQQWTLNQTGNWSYDKVDLNGDGDFVDSQEVHDHRTHNDVNELTARDTDNNASDNYTLTYDAVGNLTDDGENYTFEWDAFGRMRKIRNRANSNLIAEYRYNGLGYRISIHEDTDNDSDVDSNDKWFHHAFDERWRWVATFRETDTSPKEEFLHHAAGFDGQGTGSYIDLVVLRNRDANTGWTSASDGTLEERLYYCQNWRADVVALVTAAGAQVEQVRYSAYGVPFGLPAGDCDSDGDCESVDASQVATWIAGPTYNVLGDGDLDGDVDGTDESALEAASAGRSELSTSDTNNGRGYAGYYAMLGDSQYDVRRRHLMGMGGRWTSRDSLEYIDGMNQYEYTRSNPILHADPLGMQGGTIPGNPTGGVRECPAQLTGNSGPPLQCWGEWWRLNIKGVNDPQGLIATPGEGVNNKTTKQCKADGQIGLKIQLWDPQAGGWRGVRPPADEKWCKAWHNTPDCKPGQGSNQFPTWTVEPKGMPKPPDSHSESLVDVAMAVDCKEGDYRIWHVKAHAPGCTLTAAVFLFCD